MKMKRNKAFEQIIKLTKVKKDKEIDWHKQKTFDQERHEKRFH